MATTNECVSKCAISLLGLQLRERDRLLKGEWHRQNSIPISLPQYRPHSITLELTFGPQKLSMIPSSWRFLCAFSNLITNLIYLYVSKCASSLLDLQHRDSLLKGEWHRQNPIHLSLWQTPLHNFGVGLFPPRNFPPRETFHDLFLLRFLFAFSNLITNLIYLYLFTMFLFLKCLISWQNSN